MQMELVKLSLQYLLIWIYRKFPRLPHCTFLERIHWTSLKWYEKLFNLLQHSVNSLPLAHPHASENSGMFMSGTLTRYLSKEWLSVSTLFFFLSGLSTLIKYLYLTHSNHPNGIVLPAERLGEWKPKHFLVGDVVKSNGSNFCFLVLTFIQLPCLVGEFNAAIVAMRKIQFKSRQVKFKSTPLTQYPRSWLVFHWDKTACRRY